MSVTSDVERRIGELTKPLKDEQRGIDRRLAEIDAEQKELKAARRRIDQVLRQLDPGSFVSAAKKNGRGVVNASHVGSAGTLATKQANIRAYLDTNHDYYEEHGIIAAKVYREMKDDEIEPVASPSVVLETIREMHAQGVLRADRKVKGGAMMYQWVGTGVVSGA